MCKRDRQQRIVDVESDAVFLTADFGVARVLDRASIAKSFCGKLITPFSAVLELLHEMVYLQCHV